MKRHTHKLHNTRNKKELFSSSPNILLSVPFDSHDDRKTWVNIYLSQTDEQEKEKSILVPSVFLSHLLLFDPQPHKKRNDHHEILKLLLLMGYSMQTQTSIKL